MGEFTEPINLYRITTRELRFDGLTGEPHGFIVSGESAYKAREYFVARFGPAWWERQQIVDIEPIGRLVNLYGKQLWEGD